ncbi:Fucose permease [Octadecabacter temperatus]|uniref:Inner membrane protein YbjJ n=1 Tax=Octadecabacter temperatus TaxID=1458307 RepID=A0A0K0Y999_9RHOB|nr:MFS transporter [Octadecabacter temperatus]AKS47495.1 Inner membrane protein YbjJ [Octadecabacter temperatus]SIO42046.1 Fucose permease [Octadecabacter temperatus]
MTQTNTRTATLLIMALFALQPMAFGAWLAMIPYIKETLELSKGQLAVALLGMPVALIPTLQLASRVVAKIGPRKTFAFLLPIQTVFALLPFLATSIPTLFGALAMLGATVAFLEVALNTYAGRLEKAESLNIMSRCHGFWALGVGIGSFLATFLFGIGPMLAVFVICAASAAAGVWAGLKLPQLAGEEDAAQAKPRKLSQMPKALFIIAMFVFTISLAEGAMADWAAVYLAERWGGGAEDAGIAVTVFAGFLAGGRFIGDYMKGRLGSRGVARLTVGLALIGVCCLTLTSSVPFTFVGFALIGLGVSIGFPLGVSAAASLDDSHEAQNIATMAMIAMSAFLFGPPLIGLVSEAFSLRVAFLGLFPGLCLAFWLARVFPAR